VAYNWNWSVFLSETAVGDGEIYLQWLGWGLLFTVGIATIAWIFAFLLGCVLGALRTSSNVVWVRIVAWYVEIFRNIPLLVQLFIWYFVVPDLLPERASQPLKNSSPYLLQFSACLLCLVAFTSARVCEQIRAGIEGIGRMQRQAAFALGLTVYQTYRLVLLPQALRTLVPSLTSEMVNIMKNTTVCSTIGLMELSAQGRQLVDYTAQPYEAFLSVTVAYVLVNATILCGMSSVERRLQLRGNLTFN
jgi:glutamate/aspartate transport system permease protein